MLPSIFTFAKKVVFSPVSVCLSVNTITQKKTTEQNFMKVYEMVEHNTWTNKLDFE